MFSIGLKGNTIQYNDTRGFEFWSISQVLIKMYRKTTKNETYKLNNNHAN